ncbi:MAG: hypothetical protein P8M22_06225 [Phycisphaerales bacterium]|nr:hypothetical protein [Phycisphaerales bacterium]
MKRLIPFVFMTSACLVGCGYQPAPMAPDPYTESTVLGHDWPIGTGQPGTGENLDTMAGTVSTEE